jgi:hypothetical protein
MKIGVFIYLIYNMLDVDIGCGQDKPPIPAVLKQMVNCSEKTLGEY